MCDTYAGASFLSYSFLAGEDRAAGNIPVIPAEYRWERAAM